MPPLSSQAAFERARAVLVLLLAILASVLVGAGAAKAFETGPFRGLDLAAAARAEHGPGARALAIGPHLYDWRAEVNGTHKGLDLLAGVRRQHGADFVPVAVGVGASDWRALSLRRAPASVLPVLVVVAADLFQDLGAVNSGRRNYESVLRGLEHWWRRTAGMGYVTLTPILLRSDKPAREWNRLSTISTDAAHRYDLLYEAKGLFERTLGRRPVQIRVAMAVLTGDHPDAWLGAASVDGFAVVPARATSLLCPLSGLSERCADAAYALGHELGHAFGLDHSCAAFPGAADCDRSIMERGKPDAAILLPGEVRQLRATPFFR